MFFDRAYPDFLPRSTAHGRVCAFKERRMMFADATNFSRKSGVAQWIDLLFFPSHIRSNLQNFNIPVYHNSHSQPTHFVTVANTYKCWRVRA